ncbi:MAG: hypothetical protein HYU33_04730 [Candidatus Omnitrophica bacterium]|nr:hypothetical protein [Candidatus Omnitrophota bacterium]
MSASEIGALVESDLQRRWELPGSSKARRRLPSNLIFPVLDQSPTLGENHQQDDRAHHEWDFIGINAGVYSDSFNLLQRRTLFRTNASHELEHAQGVGNSQAEETRLTQQDSLLAAEWLGPDEQEEASFLYALSRIIERPGFFEALELQLALPPRWDDPRVQELAEDIRRHGVSEPRFTASTSPLESALGILSVFEHRKTHLRIIRKPILAHEFAGFLKRYFLGQLPVGTYNRGEIEHLIETAPEGYVPTFLSSERATYYELDLRLSGHWPLNEQGIIEPSLKQRLVSVLDSLHKDAELTHTHPHRDNWMVGPRGNVVLIDAKFLRRATSEGITTDLAILDAVTESSEFPETPLPGHTLLDVWGSALIGSILIAIAWVASPILGFFALLAAIVGIILLFQGPGPLRRLIQRLVGWIRGQAVTSEAVPLQEVTEYQTVEDSMALVAALPPREAVLTLMEKISYASSEMQLPLARRLVETYLSDTPLDLIDWVAQSHSDVSHVLIAALAESQDNSLGAEALLYRFVEESSFSPVRVAAIIALVQRQAPYLLTQLMRSRKNVDVILEAIEEIGSREEPVLLARLQEAPTLPQAIADVIRQDVLDFKKSSQQLSDPRTNLLYRRHEAQRMYRNFERHMRQKLIQGIHALVVLQSSDAAIQAIQNLDDASLIVATLGAIQDTPSAFREPVLEALRHDDKLKRLLNRKVEGKAMVQSVEAAKAIGWLRLNSDLEQIASTARWPETQLQALTSLIELGDEAALRRLSHDRALVHLLLSVRVWTSISQEDLLLYQWSQEVKLLNVLSRWIAWKTIGWTLQDSQTVAHILGIWERQKSALDAYPAGWDVIPHVLHPLLNEQMAPAPPAVQASTIKALDDGQAYEALRYLALHSRDPQMIASALKPLRQYVQGAGDVSWPKASEMSPLAAWLAEITIAILAAKDMKFDPAQSFLMPLIKPLFEKLLDVDPVNQEALTVLAAWMGLYVFGSRSTTLTLQPFLEQWMSTRVAFANLPQLSDPGRKWGRRSSSVRVGEQTIVVKRLWPMEDASQELLRAALTASLLAASGVDPETLPVLYDAGAEAYAYQTHDPRPWYRLTDERIPDIHSRLRQAALELGLLVGMGGWLTLAPASHEWHVDEQPRPVMPTDPFRWMNAPFTDLMDVPLFDADSSSQVLSDLIIDGQGHVARAADFVRYVNIGIDGHLMDWSDGRWGQGPWEPTSVARRVGQTVCEFTWIALRAIARNDSRVRAGDRVRLVKGTVKALEVFWQVLFGESIPQKTSIEMARLLNSYIHADTDKNAWLMATPNELEDIAPWNINFLDYNEIWQVAWYFAKAAYDRGEVDLQRTMLLRLRAGLRILDELYRENGNQPLEANRDLWRAIHDRAARYEILDPTRPALLPTFGNTTDER